jgi:hypothetical protein
MPLIERMINDTALNVSVDGWEAKESLWQH